MKTFLPRLSLAALTLTSALAGELRIEAVGFAHPESVLHDPKADVYLVSNISGSPGNKDGDGFISRVSPEGKVLDLKWIHGGEGPDALDAPKGMALVGDTLWVADLDRIHRHDRITGAPKGPPLAPKGAVFLNDLAAGPDGIVYASDTGFGAPDAQAVYAIDRDLKIRKLIGPAGLDKPNGIAVSEAGLWVVSLGSKTLLQLDLDGKVLGREEAPAGGLDGVVLRWDDHTLLVSSWDGKAIYRRTPDGKYQTAWSDLESAADIGYDAGRHRVLVPLMMQDAVRILW